LEDVDCDKSNSAYKKIVSIRNDLVETETLALKSLNKIKTDLGIPLPKAEQIKAQKK
jgi:hypothetical protein